MSSTLRYHAGAEPEDLAVNECVVRPCSDGAGGVYPRLWFLGVRSDNGQPEMFGCPLNPGGSYVESPRKTWGLARVAPGVWQVSPSINVLVSLEPHPGEHPTEASIWHQTPQLVDVPEPPPWSAP